VRYLHEPVLENPGIEVGPRSSTLQTADRALAVLQLFSSPGQSLSVTEMARQLGLNRSTASRLTATLEARGFLERRGPGQQLRLGPELARLGRVALGERDLAAVAEPELERLAAKTGENVTLAVPAADADAVCTLAQADGKHFVSSGHWVGLVAAPHCSSDGKVLLAWDAMPVPEGDLLAYTANTITDREALARELELVRANGYAEAYDEMEEGLVGMAVPVFDGDSYVAALCVSGPAYRLREAVRSLVPVCQQSAAVIAQRLAGGLPTSAEPDAA
jgi:IclR family transcriptional regulator, acetate operon repressor